MNLFSKAYIKLEMKRSFKKNMIWSFSLGLSILLIVAIYPLVQDMMASIVELMESLDENNPMLAFMEDFGGFPTNIIEYFATEGALILQLVGGIYAAILGFAIINKDEKENTNEVLYTLPISRKKVLSSKMITVAINLLLFTIIQFALTTIGFISLNATEDIGILWLFGLLNYMLFLMIASFGLGLSVILKPNQSSMLSVIIPFPFYIITTISTATDNDILKSLKYISPFTFAEPVGFLKTNEPFAWINFFIFLGVMGIIILLSYIKYQKREII